MLNTSRRLRSLWSMEALERRVLLCSIPAAQPLPHTNTSSFGDKKVLYVRAAFSDNPGEPQSSDSALGAMTQADQFVRRSSFGRTSFTPTFTTVIDLGPQSNYPTATTNLDTFRTTALAAAKVEALRLNAQDNGTRDWDWTHYDLDVLRWNGQPAVPNGGQGTIDGRGVWLNVDGAGTLTHELGHNLGLNHANSWETTTTPGSIVGAGTNHEYGNPFDPMGPSNIAGDYNVFEKNKLKWVPDADVTTVTTSGTYKIYPSDGATLDSDNRQYALHIGKDGQRDYWLGVRGSPAFADNPSVMNGVEVLWSPWTLSNAGTQILDMTPETPSSASDGFLTIGRTFTDAVDGINITPVRKNDDGSFDVRVECENPTDAAPTINSLSATSSAVDTGTSVTFTASVTDPDTGDEIAYHWDFGDGAVSTNSATVSKAWQRSGDYRVRVTASDMKGKTASRSVLVRVAGARSSRTSGHVYDVFGAPVQDAKVTPDGFNGRVYAYTDSDGSYTIVTPASYSTTESASTAHLSVSKPGWTFAPANGGDATFANGPDTVGADFRGTEALYTISGRVSTSSPNSVALAGVLVSDGVHRTETDAAGNFSLAVGNGTYTLNFTKEGYVFDRAVVKVEFADPAFAVYLPKTYQVRGSLVGLPANVAAKVTDGVRTATAIRQANGDYTYTLQVPAGTWHLTASAQDLAGNVIGITPSNFSDPLAVPVPTGTLINFSATPAAFTVRGRLTKLGDPLVGANVTAAGVTTTTDSDGRYSFPGLVNGTYTVTPAMPGYTFTPASRSVTVNNNDRTGQDFATTTVNQPPSLNVSADPPAGVPTGVRLSVTADGGRTDFLSYHWSLSSFPAGGAAIFVRNDSNLARSTIATFTRAGSYVLQVQATDRHGATNTAPVTVNVSSTLSAIVVTPGTADVLTMASQTYAASARDQFGTALVQQPSFTWSSFANGPFGSAGLYTAGRGTRMDTVTASSGSVSGSAAVSIHETRFVFYNHSSYDGNSAAADETDDFAVAVDKYALLPGQTATFANYTSYSRGINGIMVDLPDTAGVPTAADFEFKVGNDTNPGAWATAPAPTSVLVRPLYGVDFRTRVTIVWADNAIQNRWLRVKVLANSRTGLTSPDVFYFGNLIGETGDPTNPARVNALDLAGVKAHPTPYAPLDNRFDFDRDGKVDAADEDILKLNLNSILTLFTA